ncbi:hypothetical protein CO007_00065 [Candidatus Roizmanbacteria bacterium CG_4_8_14_3_um_filter_36_10]|uniref:O-antigen ligase-related domain-containing protein n=1 Tax=Candidatus Roizmanbacteria bacterium CG_4_8_14_3_um_filter_36_10 TaxID=1974834 RepID=A0A2M8GP36_9BACT|nr:MAG: hypothetical protein CO166_01305 [Candidatus Roizmanbacteria bacterium CG_4_9_14_3_um_filter_36_11]PJC82322.1 MAG: hypothetical protein CO007_00065 [Candidatus Roizmanbacteria bacterium CG_4_8_14_3_um_filter_36_10]
MKSATILFPHIKTKLKFKNINSLFFNLFLIALFLFRIPSFYLAPTSTSSFLTSQALARILFIGIFLYLLARNYFQNKQIFFKKGKKFLINIIIAQFIIQSMTIFIAVNFYSFWTRYKDIILGIASLFIFYFYQHKTKKIIKVILFGTFVNVAYQSLIFFAPSFYTAYLGPLIYKNQSELVLLNLARSRIYIDAYDEIFIPFILLISFSQKLSKKILSYLFFLIICFFSFISNWRTRIVMLIFSSMSSFYIYRRYIKSKIVLFLASLLIISFLINIISVNILGHSFVDRFISNGELDVTSIESRFNQINNGIDIGSVTILGVGLGNYYDNLPNHQKNFTSINQLASQQAKIATEYIHNNLSLVIAESGYFSFLLFIIILFLFIRSDILILKHGYLYNKGLVIAFWTLFIYGFFNPPIPGSYQVLFWGIRGLLL